jgi:hypothetical protein
MLNAQFRPLDHWPVERTEKRRDATFRATYVKTLDELEYELQRLGAHDTVIQIEGLTRDDIRNDGWPRSGNWKNGYGGPGVVLSFDSPKGSMSFPCDRFGDWQDNLRAIAKSLEALRMVDRYGVTRGNEQYKGWARLEAPSPETNREGAIQTIASILNVPRENVAANPAPFIKEARIRYHPDGVTDEGMKKQRHEMSVLISKAEAVLFPPKPDPAHAG